MALTFDWVNKVVESSASITDLPVFHASLRDAEWSAVGAVYPIIHSYKRLDLGGAYFHAVDFVNGWALKFPSAGNYTINGNLNATIVPVAGVYVERKTSAAFATTAVGGSGPSALDVAAAVRAEIAAELLRVVELAQVHGLVTGTNLVVTPTSRVAGSISQTISEAGSTVTVSRP